MDRDIRRSAPDWQARNGPIARERPVAMLGMGALGTACAQALAALNAPSPRPACSAVISA